MICSPLQDTILLAEILIRIKGIWEDAYSLLSISFTRKCLLGITNKYFSFIIDLYCFYLRRNTSTDLSHLKTVGTDYRDETILYVSAF